MGLAVQFGANAQTPLEIPDTLSARPPAMSKRRFNLEFQVQDGSNTLVRCERIPFDPDSSVQAFREEIAARSGWVDFELGVKFETIGFLHLYDGDQLRDSVGHDESMVCLVILVLIEPAS